MCCCSSVFWCCPLPCLWCLWCLCCCGAGPLPSGAAPLPCGAAALCCCCLVLLLPCCVLPAALWCCCLVVLLLCCVLLAKETGFFCISFFSSCTSPAHLLLSQRSLHDAPIFRLLLKVAVNGTHQCDFLNFCGALGLQ